MQQTKTTRHLTMPALPRNLDLPMPVALAVVIFSLLGIVGAIGRIQSTPSAAAVPTAPLPIIIIASPQPIAVPLVAPAPVQVAAAPAGNRTRRAIVAYGAPDMATAIGAVEAGRAFTPVAHYGADWMQVDISGSGVVFVRVADLYDVPPGLVDLKPPQVVVQPIYVNRPVETNAEYPAAPLVAPAEQPYQIDSAPQPAQEAQTQATPVPPQPTAAPVPVGNLGHDTDVERAWAIEQQRQEGRLP